MTDLNAAALEAIDATERAARPDNSHVVLMSAILANPAIHARFRKRAHQQLDRISQQRGVRF